MITNKSISTLTDEQLVIQYKESSDSQLFGEIYNRYHERVYFTCLGLVKNRDTAYDMVQDVMIKVMEHLTRLENGFLLGLWINRISKNHCIDYLKRLNRQPVSELDGTPEIAANPMDIDAIWEEEAIFVQMEAALTQLSEEEQELIRLKYTEGCSVLDLQDKLKINKSAVKMRLARTRKKLAGLM